jgi:ribosomal-protein-alanine N-acetyltransferase
MQDVTIAPVRTADAAELIQANLENRDYHAPWAQPFTDRDGFDSWFGRIMTGPNLGFVARERGSGAIVGVVNVNEIVWGVFRSAYLGYYGMARWSRRGLMTQAIRKASLYAFDEIRLHRLEANIQPDNIASIALVRRLGFVKEGFSPQYLMIGDVWRDHERWALLANNPAG